MSNWKTRSTYSPGEEVGGVAVTQPGAPDQSSLHRVVGGEVSQVDQCRALHVRHTALPKAAHATLTHDLTERVRGVLHSVNRSAEGELSRCRKKNRLRPW